MKASLQTKEPHQRSKREKENMQKHHDLIIISFIFAILIFNVCSFTAGKNSGESSLASKAYLLRYWNKKIDNDMPKSSFLIEKASPLNASESAKFTKLASDQNLLSRDLHSFCKSAGLVCFPDISPASSFLTKPDQKQYNIFGPHRNIITSASTNSVSVEEKQVSGNFFRESMLRKGIVMLMPDIRDKMPKRSFLPRAIVSKLPFSSLKMDEIKSLFHAIDNSSMDIIISNGIKRCERAPSSDETKQCVGSIEDMIDFATLILGRSIMVRTTANVAGSKKDIMIGSIKRINGGKLTKSVTCHPTLYPYLLYYCHSSPKVHVYEAEIMDPKTKVGINHGIAICHLDTSTWSPTYEAFLSLGSGPGKIEVCHWIFQNDLTWTIAHPE